MVFASGNWSPTARSHLGALCLHLGCNCAEKTKWLLRKAKELKGDWAEEQQMPKQAGYSPHPQASKEAPAGGDKFPVSKLVSTNWGVTATGYTGRGYTPGGTKKSWFLGAPGSNTESVTPGVTENRRFSDFKLGIAIVIGSAQFPRRS